LHASRNIYVHHQKHQAQRTLGLRPAHRRSRRQSAEVQCLGACLENFMLVHMGVCMLLEIYTATTRNTNLKEHLACGRLTDDQGDYRTRLMLRGLSGDFFLESSVTLARLRKPQPYSVKKCQEGMGQPVLTPTPRLSLTRGAVTRSCR
jgi:hypothetical protein